MQYNTQKAHLLLSDYGRTVQDMVQYALTIDDRERRTQCAYAIVNVMAHLTGLSLKSEVNQQKLWDHLIEISGYRLDVDTPVDITPQEQRTSRPHALPYPAKRIQARHYGANIEAVMKRLTDMPEGEERDTAAALAANQMKRLLTHGNNLNNNDDRILADIERYTRGNIVLPPSFRFANPNVKCSQGSNALIGGKKKKKK